MRVVFLEDVPGVAQGGDVKEVKNGFARNYLIPQNLAVHATHNALQRVTRLAKEADDARLKTLNDMRALAEALNDTQVNIEMRAGASGRLYGSVTSAIIADELSKIIDREIDRRMVLLPESIRELGAFDVSLRLHPDVDAQVKVLVYATGTDPFAQAEVAEDEAEEPEEAVAEIEEATVAETEEALVAEAEDEFEDKTQESDER